MRVSGLIWKTMKTEEIIKASDEYASRFDRDYRAYAAEDFIAGARFADKKSDEYAEEFAKEYALWLMQQIGPGRVIDQRSIDRFKEYLKTSPSAPDKPTD